MNESKSPWTTGEPSSNAPDRDVPDEPFEAAPPTDDVADAAVDDIDAQVNALQELIDFVQQHKNPGTATTIMAPEEFASILRDNDKADGVSNV